jgi:alkyl sulfatase BDS1-like metallo-beta-lactamase superfamily hydrolase
VVFSDRSASSHSPAYRTVYVAISSSPASTTSNPKLGVLNARRGASPDARLMVSGPKAALVGVILQPGPAGQLAQAGKIQLDGDQSALAAFAGLLDEFDLDFNIVTP